MRRRLWLLSLIALGAHASEADEPADPRVVAAWAAGPFEARVTLDRPVGADLAAGLVGRTIAFDETRRSVGSRGAGSGPTGSLRIAAARLVDDGRTLVLTTDPHPRAATYTLELPLGRPGKTLAVAYDLTGVEAAWTEDGKDETPAVTTWWPTLDPATVRKELAGSPEHVREFALLGRKGKLALNTLVTLPRGWVMLTFSAGGPFEATLNGEGPNATADNRAVFHAESTAEPMLLTITLTTGETKNPLTLGVTARLRTPPDSTPVAVPMFLPWTPASPPPPAPLETVPDLTGGDPRKGAIVFAGTEAKCANCHRVRGQGGTVGPDLSGLVGRDRKEVYRDIAEPSARINPDYVPYTLALKDGRILVGTVRAEGADAVRVTDTEAKITVARRSEVDEFRPSATSVMPVGLAGAIGEERLRDLIAFLTTPPEK